MTRTMNIAIAVVVGFAAVNAQYMNSNATYLADMECANCIRSGNNFCLNIGGNGTATIINWECSQNLTKGWEINNKSGGVPSGYMCSKGMDDQMNAIVNGCRPWLNQNTGEDDCGPYLVDLTDINSAVVGRSVQNMKVNSSCIYRAVSNCGYPEAQFRIHNATFHPDFDVAWATKDGIDSGDDLDGWEPKLRTDWNGSAHSAYKTEYYTLNELAFNKNIAPIANTQWDSCKGMVRNLWVVVTRTQDSSKLMSTEGLAQNARQLNGLGGPYYPGGALYPAFEVNFRNMKGAATALIGAIGVAVASLAVLAF